MDIAFEMQAAEMELRRLLGRSPGQSMNGIVEAYTRRSSEEKEAIVIVLAAHITGTQALSSPSSAASAKTVLPSDELSSA